MILRSNQLKTAQKVANAIGGLALILPVLMIGILFGLGAVGLIGMAEFVGSDREAGLDHFVHSLIVIITIGLGVLVGNPLVPYL